MESLDTTTAPGRMMLQMVGAFAEFERAILRERTKAGLDAGRKRGRIGGRRPKLKPDHQDRMKSLRWCRRGRKLRLMPQGFSMYIPATVSRILASIGAESMRLKA